jgi:hypothetical protein
MRSLAFLFLVACSGGAKPAPETPAPPTSSMLDCGKVADHVATTVAADKPRPGATHAAVKELVSTRCAADKWTDETMQCLFVIKTIKEGRDCASKMTDEQKTAIKTAAKELRKANAGSEPPPDDDHEGDWIKHVVQDKPDTVPH